MKEVFFCLGLVIQFLQGIFLILNARKKNVCGCIVNATSLIILTIALTR